VALVAAEADRSRKINAEIRSIKETLRKRFAKLAHSFETSLRGFSAELAAIDGPLEMQQTRVAVMSEDLGRLESDLDEITKAEQACDDANVDENDYTVFTLQDLQFEFDLVRQAVAKKNLFIENQIVSRNMTNLTPAQLEQFESAFRYFDKDETNTLTVSELSAALASLGIVYSDEDIDVIHQQLEEEYGAATFEAFINLLVEITEDQTTPEQLRDAFRAIAKDKPLVSEMDLKLAQLSPEAVGFLVRNIPKPEGLEELDYEGWLDSVFA